MRRGTARRLFTDEFKQEALALLASSGRSLAQVARELAVQPSVLRKWQRPLTTGVDKASETALLKRATPLVGGLFAYIEGYCNRRRPHSAPGYITPDQAKLRVA